MQDPTSTGDEPDNLALEFVFAMSEENPPEGESPITYSAYRVVPVRETPMVCLIEDDGDDHLSMMLVPVELLSALLSSLNDPMFD